MNQMENMMTHSKIDITVEQNAYGEKTGFFTLNGNDYTVEPTIADGYYVKRQFDEPVDIHGTIAIAVVKRRRFDGGVRKEVYGKKHQPCDADMDAIVEFAENFKF